ncbi:MAG: hypothetical protein AAF226_19660, partial [Verrucomicrobiota bacterium]
FPVLVSEVFRLKEEGVPLFRMLQYGGSVLGLAMLFISYGVGILRFCNKHHLRLWQDLRRWLMITALVISTIGFAVALNMDSIPSAMSFYAFRVLGFKFLITWLPIFCFAYLGLSTFGRAAKSTR